MFGRAIWDKLPKYIFENSEIPKFSKITSVTYPKNYWNQTCSYWLITPNQKTLWKNLISFNSGQLQLASGQLENSCWLQHNTINGAMSVTINCVINQVI